MEPSYSVVADALSKFHTSSESIKTLWLISVSLTVVGTTACVMRGVKEIVAVIARRGERQGHPICTIYQAADGSWMLYAHGAVREPSGENIGPGDARQPSPIQQR